MAVESAFASVIFAAVGGLVLSVAIERLMTPMPSMSRPWSAWSLHVGVWLLAYGLFALPLGRPWFAAAIVSAILLMLVLVNNAKVRALREPFVFQDYEYFTDAIRHPRLYIPFLGWGKFSIATVGFFLAMAVGIWGEPVPAHRFSLAGQLGGVATMLVVGTILLVAGSRMSPGVSLQPDRDLVALGLLASLWRYAEEGRIRPAVASPFDSLVPSAYTRDLPHMVAVQSESFFDPRPLYAGIRDDVLAEFDRAKASAVSHGKLKVPAWGANTVRTEFAFLSGLDETRLGAHRFNPYQAVAAGWDVPSLATFLKRLGYRTVCIHPYPASFYSRNRVCPSLGFDEFLDIRAFAGAERFGPYVSDASVAEKISEILDKATSPIFVFAITMENHGPLHLERIAEGDIANLYIDEPPANCDELTIYLRHLCNADRMIVTLRQKLERFSRPTGLCWFGDHVPVMPAVYQALGVPEGETDFLFWSNCDQHDTEEKPFAAHQLAVRWLRSMKMIGDH